MTNELTKPEMCIYLRSGIELWVEKEKATQFGDDLVSGSKAIVKINGQYVNTVDIVGIFDPTYLEELKKRKQGKWKCNYNNWHERDGVCECARNIKTEPENEQTPEQRKKALEALEKVRGELNAKFER